MIARIKTSATPTYEYLAGTSGGSTVDAPAAFAVGFPEFGKVTQRQGGAGWSEAVHWDRLNQSTQLVFGSKFREASNNAALAKIVALQNAIVGEFEFSASRDGGTTWYGFDQAVITMAAPRLLGRVVYFRWTVAGGKFKAIT